MSLESIAKHYPSQETQQSSPDEKFNSEDAIQSLRISARRVQRLKDERKESECSEVLDDPLSVPGIVQNNDAESKQKRTWEQWSGEDKAVFFEALNECGKNFEAIEKFISQKNSKNKHRVLKNKDQIRTFYYRTWHKICKYVDFTEDYSHLKKSSKELYGLINFGELRKRLGSQLDDKTGLKLRELIFKGHTSVRLKGKTTRLRTPTCPALKRLNESNAGLNRSTSATTNEDFTSSSSKLTLRLSPASTDDFDRVHRHAMANPNITFTLTPGRSLASVFQHLIQRWKISKKDEETLFIVPRPGTKMEMPDLSVVGPKTNAALSLSNLNEIKKDETTTTEEESKSAVNGISNTTETVFEWNISSAKSLSIGELFLMSGSPSNCHLELHYTWKKFEKTPLPSAMSILAKLANSELSKKKSNASVLSSSSSSPKTSKTSTDRPNSPTSDATINEHESESHEFRRPTIPASKPAIQQHQAFKQQLETLMPKYNMRKGRPLSRLKRPLPANKRNLQPAPAIKSPDGKLKFRLYPTGTSLNQHPLINVQQLNNTTNIVTSQFSSTSSQSATSSSSARNLDIDPGNSNDSINSTLAFFEPQASQPPMTSKTDHFLDSVLENSNSSVLQTPPRVRPTPPTSPSRAVSNDSWIPDLSTFLTNINSSSSQGSSGSKNNEQKMHIVNEDSVQSNGSEVDRQLICLMSESSVDFTSKFAKLASAVVGNEDDKDA